MSSIYGFVYIWFDRRRKMYYIGSHKGHPDDGYICSSTWMRNTYNRHKEDFRRRIIAIITEQDRKLILAEEQKWLSMIKQEELGKKYYNFKREASGFSWEGLHHSEETKAKIAEARKKTWNDPEYREMMVEKFKAVPGERRSHPHTEESKAKMRAVETPRGGDRWSGKTMSKETKAKMSETRTSKKTVRNTSGYVGVSWHKPAQKWCVCFKDKYIGLFTDIEQAHQAYLIAKKEGH